MAEELSPQSVVDLISRLREASNKFISDSLKEKDLTGIVPAHGQVIYPLFSQEEHIHLSDIVKRSGRAKSTITGMADTLEKHGYIKRIPCPYDKRGIHVELTDNGRELEEVFRGISSDLIKTIYKDVSQEEQVALMKILATMETNLSPRG